MHGHPKRTAVPPPPFPKATNPQSAPNNKNCHTSPLGGSEASWMKAIAKTASTRSVRGTSFSGSEERTSMPQINPTKPRKMHTNADVLQTYAAMHQTRLFVLPCSTADRQLHRFGISGRVPNSLQETNYWGIVQDVGYNR